ncbi:Dimeric alpha-beta barrel [Lasiodiplodia theobromae]|uniref:Dimeric alpha-beta barrel n=1 Tax=Lasiodiplodia theobromae TaxID=45133 RepID=UPI0015C3163B|nr:Dimeric alpha-beta barrel [Lasiodiplodia theobromae]KAF4546751.1 Dimeric alpha-beta barrel [Lasiodiplodia theobromae]
MASQPHQTGETTEKVIKVQILHYRNPNMTEEEYYDYWTKIHAKMAAPWLARNGVLKYAIYHTPKEYRDKLAPMAQNAGWKIHEHDGSVELWVRSLDDLARATKDPDYIANIHPDQPKFLDESKTEVIVGWEEVRVRDGVVV